MTLKSFRNTALQPHSNLKKSFLSAKDKKIEVLYCKQPNLNITYLKLGFKFTQV